MYKKILLPLDGSQLAECALHHAESLARAYDSTVILFSAISTADIVGRAPANVKTFDKTMDAHRTGVENYLKELKDALTSKKIEVETHIGVEPVVKEIIETAETYDVDLVVIASHGRSGLARVFFGSVASGVVNNIKRPLMVIHPSDE
jgi:nucleotide-binding universal stress UspA family protein